MPVRAEAAGVAAADKDGEAVEVAAADPDGDAEWPADQEWMQTCNPHSRVIHGYRAHIARSGRVRIKTSRVRARVDSVRASRAQEWADSVRVSRLEACAHTARDLDAGT